MKNIIVVDLGFGDAGKGSIVDFLSRQCKEEVTVVRYNGGSQAAHNVVTPTGLHHTFSQIGSGAFVGANTFLSRFMVVDPIAFLPELNHLYDLGMVDSSKYTYVDENALVVTPYHKEANRLREMKRGICRHGSCGVGIGEAKKDEAEGLALRIKDIYANNHQNILAEIKKKKEQEFGPIKTLLDYYPLPDYLFYCVRNMKVVPSSFLKHLSEHSTLIFEGAQGVHLDMNSKFFPYVTYSNCTTDNAWELIRNIELKKDVHTLGVTRTYMTRHGVGPFPTGSSTLREKLIKHEKHNVYNSWQGNFRIGELSYPLLRSSIERCKVDSVAINHLDIFPLSEGSIPIKNIECELCSPVSILSYGPTCNDKIIIKERDFFD